MGTETTAEVAAEPERRPDDAVIAPPTAANLTGPLTANRVLALQRAVGNAAVGRLMAARQPTPAPAAAPPAAAPVVAPFGWTDAALGQRVDAGTTEQLAAYLAGMSQSQRDTAIAELQGARHFYRGGIPGAADDPTRVVMAQRAQRADVALQGEYRDDRPGPGHDRPRTRRRAAGRPARAPPDLMAGTHTPTTAERDALRDAMAPARRRTATGQLADFHSVIPGQFDAYEQRIYRALHATIDRALRPAGGQQGAAGAPGRHPRQPVRALRGDRRHRQARDGRGVRQVHDGTGVPPPQRPPPRQPARPLRGGGARPGPARPAGGAGARPSSCSSTSSSRATAGSAASTPSTTRSRSARRSHRARRARRPRSCTAP